MHKINIWQRDFDIELVYDIFPGETASKEQEDAFSKFISNKKQISDSLVDIEKYCLEENGREIGTDTIDNIFKYVVPESIFVKRDGRVAIMCKYRFDLEHGIAIVFREGKLEQIGKQDIVL